MQAKAPKVKRLGSEVPRVWTRPLRELTPETSLGFSVIAFATVLGIDLLPWERWLLIHAMELNPDGTFRFRVVVLLVARQNGKSLVMQVLALWSMFVNASRMVVGTAQSLDISEEQWQAAVDLAQDVDELAEMIKHIDRSAGKKAMRLVTGERYKVAAATRRGGRGLSGDLILMDELREHTNWESWAAVTKTTMARKFAQIWAASNAGDGASIVLRYLRNVCHAALGNPDGIDGLDDMTLPPEAYGDDENFEQETFEDSIGIFEWSAPPGMSIWDRSGWAMANPSLGYTITERAIYSAAQSDPEWIFRTEVLCQWRETTDEGIFPPGQWEAATDGNSKRDGKFMLCVDTAQDRSMTYIAWVALRQLQPGEPEESRELLHVEIIAARGGNPDWVLGWLDERRERWAANQECLGITLQANGAPVSSLLPSLQALDEKTGRPKYDWLNVIPWQGPDLSRGTGIFYDLVRGRAANHDETEEIEDPETDVYGPPLFRHRDQSPLNLAAARAAVKPSGDAFIVDRRASPVDAAPLVAVIGGVWAFTSARPAPPVRSKYEDEDPLVLTSW